MQDQSPPLPKERKIRLPDLEDKPSTSTTLSSSSSSSLSLPVAPLTEWEQVSIEAALAEESKDSDIKQEIKRSKSDLPIPDWKLKSLEMQAAFDHDNEVKHQPASPLPILPKPSVLMSATGVQFPTLRAALQSQYRQVSHLRLPVSEKLFPINDVSLTISDKSEQDKQEHERRLAEEKAKKEGKSREPKSDDEKGQASDKDKRDKKQNALWSSRFRLEEEWHRISQPIAVKDLFTIEGSDKTTRRRSYK